MNRDENDMETKMSIGVTSLSKLITGEEVCPFRFWYKIRYGEGEESGKGLLEWQIKHTDMVMNLVNKLEGGEIKREEQVELDILNGKLSGKIDLLHIRDKEVILHDCKSGKKSTCHHLQMLIYLFIIKKLGLYKDKKIKGILHYDTRDITFLLDDIPEDIQLLIEKQAKILLSETPAPKYSGGSCKWCRVKCEYNNHL